jgi:hypothetical protein
MKLTGEQRDAISFAAGYLLGQDFPGISETLLTILEPAKPQRLSCPHHCHNVLALEGEAHTVCMMTGDGNPCGLLVLGTP